MRVRSSDNNEAMEVQMGPLMDMVFLLLIFFIVIAVTKKSIKELGIRLPPPTQAVAEVKPRDNDLVIRVPASGDVWIGSNQVGKQGMLEAIREAANRPEPPKVRLEIDRHTEFRHLMPIMDHLTHYGLTNWGLRSTMEEE